VDIRLYFKNQEPVTRAAGDVLFRRGDPGDLMYIVKDGTVRITYGEGINVDVGPGETLGEMALIDGHARSGDAVAATEVELYPVNRGLFLVLVQETPYFAIEVMKSLTERLRRANGGEAS
jgi:CRP/FNR family transcriptional regulator, cyclic AMP receptor protein